MKRVALILLLAACFNVQNLFCGEETPKEMKKTGTVTAIDLAKTILSIERADKKPFTFIVAKDILSKFKVGQFVEVTYAKDDKGNRVASKVKISEKPAANEKGTAAETPKKNESGDDDEIGVPKDPSGNK